MFRHNESSFLENVLANERKQFKENIVKTFIETQNTDHFFEGNVLYKIPFKRSSITTLLTDNNAVCSDLPDAVDNCSGHDLLREVSNKFLNIQANAPFQECMKIIHPYQVNAGNHFYGALLRSTRNPDIIINPFHILTALSILSSEYVNHEFNILLYFYSNREEADTTYRTEYAQPEKIKTNLNALMQSFTSKLDTELVIDDIHSSDSTPDEVKVVFKERIYDDEDSDFVNFIVASQLLTKGIIAPYYGSSLIRWNRERTSCAGIQLSPFALINISSSSRTYPSNESNTQTASVCTGEVPSTTLQGLRTLTHSNLSSAYELYGIRPGALAYADAMIAKSTALYLNAGIITPYHKIDPMKDFTEEELACTTLLDFVKLRKNDKIKQISLMEFKLQYNAMLELKADKTEVTTESSPVPDENTLTSTTSVLTHSDGNSIEHLDRIVYTNKKSGRRVSAAFYGIEDGQLISKDFSTGRTIRHTISNIEMSNSILAEDGQRLFEYDIIDFIHTIRGPITSAVIKNIRNLDNAICTINGATTFISRMSNITIRNK